jgi:hypothetical protein
MRRTTSLASRGTSPTRAMRRSRCITMPETVYTMAVWQPIGIT